jgi:hypothetical protein
LVGLVGIILVGSCGSDSSPDAGTGSVTAAVACADIAHARCTRLMTCSPTVLSLRYASESDCEARELALCTNQLAAAGTGNSPTHTEACSQAVAQWACPAFIGNFAAPASCQQQTGSGANGAACEFPGQCQSGFCAVVPGSQCGTCAAPPTAGSSCAQLDTCGPNLVCTTDNQTCAALVASGGACGKGAPCAADLSCVGSTATKMGTCMTAVATAGADCDPTQQTGPGCDRDGGLVCNGQTKKCAAIAVVGGGTACGAVNGQNQPCGDNGTCSVSTGQGTCTAAAADGTACDTAAGPGCMAFAHCVVSSAGATAGTCQAQSAATCH